MASGAWITTSSPTTGIWSPSRFPLPDARLDDQSMVPGVARGISWLREQPSSKWTERFYQTARRHGDRRSAEANRRCWSFYSMLPNLGIDIFPDQMDFFQVLPRGPGKCTIRGGTFGLPDARREMRLVRYLNARINRQCSARMNFSARACSAAWPPAAISPGRCPSRGLHVRVSRNDPPHIPEARQASAPGAFA